MPRHNNQFDRRDVKRDSYWRMGFMMGLRGSPYKLPNTTLSQAMQKAHRAGYDAAIEAQKGKQANMEKIAFELVSVANILADLKEIE